VRTVDVRPANADDTQRLVDLMAEFDAESGYVLDRRRAADAFSVLLADPRLGRVWFIAQDAAVVGYVVLAFVYAMEYGGLTAVVDDLYVRPAFRAAGAGGAALAEVRAFCAGHGIRAVSVEVGSENAAAQSVYRRAGFVTTDRRLMALRLAAPTHEE
jgi:ribosomal protein S18 acetylase RimI-like enzyme